MKSYELTAGERFRIDDGEQFALIESGKVEVYAVTRADGSLDCLSEFGRIRADRNFDLRRGRFADKNFRVRGS